MPARSFLYVAAVEMATRNQWFPEAVKTVAHHLQSLEDDGLDFLCNPDPYFAHKDGIPYFARITTSLGIIEMNSSFASFRPTRGPVIALYDQADKKLRGSLAFNVLIGMSHVIAQDPKIAPLLPGPIKREPNRLEAIAA